ncbi:5614_t:CDS:2, partial [Racocetra persica]
SYLLLLITFDLKMSTQEEYPFISRETFNNLIKKYLESKSLNRRRKTFILQTDYDLIISVLRDPNNLNLGTPKDRHWIKNSFQLRELGTETNPITQIITVSKIENGLELTHTICPFNRLYDILCKIHAGVLKHIGASKMWDVIGKQYDYIPQSFIKEFCGICKTCSTHRLFPNTLAAKPIVASNFLS